MSGGYAGKIARINLSTQTVTLIDTGLYEKWVGGHGIGAALFYDICVKEKKLNLEEIDGFHPDNLTSIMTSPFTGTPIPAAGGRTEIQGIGVHTYPKDWYTKSLVGGRIGPMIKFAGYDGIAIEGAASEPVWIDIRDAEITIRSCSELGIWGLDTVEAQKAIWSYVMKDSDTASWYSPDGASGETTQKPAVIAIGQAGEAKCRMACLIHDSGYAAGAGGFGAVWGSKNLKAVSVIGTGTFPVADPGAVVRERIENLSEYGPNIEKFNIIERSKNMLRHNFLVGAGEAYGKTPTAWGGNLMNEFAGLRTEEKGPASCMSCYGGCRGRYKSGIANESHCAGCYYYGQADSLDIQVKATDLINRYGFNTFDFYQGVPYLNALAEKGVIGPVGSGAEIETDLDFTKFGQMEWAQRFLEIIVARDTPFGDALAEGFMRALERWDRLDDIGDASEEDKAHIPLPYWGLPEHHYDARCQLEYGYGSIFSDRELCEHYFTSIFWDSYFNDNVPLNLRGYDATALEAATLSAEKMLPHATQYYTSTEDAMQMLDYSTKNMYSEHIARLVSWHRHYTRFFKASLLFCDWRYPDIINTNKKDKRGSSFTAEEKFIKAVTGKDISYLKGMEIGRKIWNLDNVIWTLQGRHRDMVYFADYIYRDDFPEEWKMLSYDPDAAANSCWSYADVGHRHLDRKKFDEFKTRFYLQEGWDPATGWPTRSTLESLGMKEVADALENWGKLGAS